MRVMVTGGGTAGHVYPALSVVATLVGDARWQTGPEDVLWVGSEQGMEGALVRREGLSFREGHEIAAAVAKAVVAMGGDLVSDGYAPFTRAFEKATGRASALDRATFAELVSPEYFVAVRTRYGGPAPEPLNAAIDGYRHRAAELAGRHDNLLERQAKAARLLRERFDALKGKA